MTRGPVVLGRWCACARSRRGTRTACGVAAGPGGEPPHGTTETFTRDQIDEWAATVSDRDGRYDWAITPGAVRDGQPVSDELIGEIVLNDLDEHARSANLRLALLPNYRGRGYGREAIFEVLRFAFEGRRTWTASGTRDRACTA